MKRRWGLIFVILAASAARSADAPPPIERTPEFVRSVNVAIERGVAWLKKAQMGSGAYRDFYERGSAGALAYLTMRVCGVPRDDPAAKSAWEALRRGYAKGDLTTYSAALYLMALTEHGDAVDGAKDDRDVKLSPEDLKWAAEIARALAAGQHAEGGWSYEVNLNASSSGAAFGGARVAGVYDHSNTQYALLGLKCAARCGVAIDHSVWTKALTHFLDVQERAGPSTPRHAGDAGPAEKDGTTAPVVDDARGWGYTVSAPYASMTAGGVSSVVICRSELMGAHEMTPKLEAESEKSVWDGLAWLGTHWRGPQTTSWSAGYPDYYECYGVERAGVLAGVEWMADLDWYAAGVPGILAAQTGNGAWNGAYGGAGPERGKRAGAVANDVIDTCFALLFLKKGTTPVRVGAVTRLGPDVDINFAEAAKCPDKDFEDFVDLVLARWRKSTDEGVKARLFDGATSVGPRIVEPLLVRMDAPDYRKRQAAHELLRRATGLDFDWKAEAEPNAREDAVLRWQTWWAGARGKIVYDPAARRLVVK